MKKLTVNSFFCGAGGFDLGFINAGFNIRAAWDFDPKGTKKGEQPQIQSYRYNIGDHVKQMDVTKMKFFDVPNADVWTFGFPCQDISIAGKQAGMVKGETRSGLFYEVMRLLEEIKKFEPNGKRLPKIIVAENVKAVRKYIPTIEEEYKAQGYRLYYQMYNSKYWNVPQNRERYFLIGVREDILGDFTFLEQQTDFIPKLSSILESNVDEKYYLSDERAVTIIEQAVNRMKRDNIFKEIKNASCLDTRQHKDGVRIYNEYAPTVSGTCYKEPKLIVETKEREIIHLGNLDVDWNNDRMKRVFDPDGVSPTVSTDTGGWTQIKVLVSYSKEGVGTLNPRKEDGSQTYQQDRIYSPEGIMPSCTATLGGRESVYEEVPRFRVRKLTPREYARLQGFPDSYEFIVSNSQIYKQMGNAVTVNVAEAVATAIKNFLEENK